MTSQPKFDPGQVVMTATFKAEAEERWGQNGTAYRILQILKRHTAGDWGDLEADDVAANDQALVDGDRLLSAYNEEFGFKVWVITEADRSATTILLPDDY